MQNAKPTVECHNSKLSFPHLIVKSKKIQLSEGKCLRGASRPGCPRLTDWLAKRCGLW